MLLKPPRKRRRKRGISQQPLPSQHDPRFSLSPSAVPSMLLPMDEATVAVPRLAADSGPSPKRRKLRKGTQSCWECKRRKAKCTFSAHTRDVCDGCQRRGTDCISQELTETPPSPRSNRLLVDRLGHVEASVKRLLKAVQNNEEEGPGLQLSSVVRQEVTPNRPETNQPTSGHAWKSSNSRPCSAECHGSQEQISSDVSKSVRLLMYRS